MKSIAEIRGEATTRYWNKWRTWLADPPASPIALNLRPPRKADLETHASEADMWLREWRTWATQHQYAALRVKAVKPSYGQQEIFTHVEFADVAALASIDPSTAHHWHIAQHRTNRVLAEGGSLLHIRRHLAAIVELPTADFTLLISAATWFRLNPRSGLLPRQVPIEGMHTKWLAKHRRLVLAMLGTNPSPSTHVEEDRESDDLNIDQRDLDALGLVAAPPMIDLILGDSEDRRRVGGLRHLRAPVPELGALPLSPRVVAIVENKESALIVPDAPGLVIIHSLGNHLNVLEQLPWLRDVPVYYWGDLDRAGITLLSRARSFVPQIRSVLMDMRTVNKFEHLAVPEAITRVDPPRPTLTQQELETLRRITGGLHEGGHLQLEQERLPEAFVLDSILQTVLGGVDRG